jgi:2-polyprenyl-6-methoxyphenol hydroxylase-like FAD-dependent oxidoreductase
LETATDQEQDVLIVGAGIGGLTLALMLHRAGVPCRVYEAVPELMPIGVGINLLPHASRELIGLGLENGLAERAVMTKESCFFNRYGQFIYREPTGRYAGYDWPQFSIHRGDLHEVLYQAAVERIGADRVLTGWKCTGVEQDESVATTYFAERPSQRSAVVVACDGVKSTLRRQFYPDEGALLYSGINMWRGVTVQAPFLSGASMVRIGWLNIAKLLVYPIRNNVDGQGAQLINWVMDVAKPDCPAEQDWNHEGSVEDFIERVRDWRFGWLDVPALCQGAEQVLEYPMVDRDPLPRWSFGRVTLLGDAAHPMYPRGANGSAQAILDCAVLARELGARKDKVCALQDYEAVRRPATASVVLANRSSPPDAILREVSTRTGDQPFKRISDVISEAELLQLSSSYEKVAGYDMETLNVRERSAR